MLKRFVLFVLMIPCLGISAVTGPAVASDIPDWLEAHVGTGGEQIAAPVLERARALYLRKKSEGEVANPCYFAMDATRPNDGTSGAGRFYTICEADRRFRVISSGHGSGRNLGAAANFANDKRCVKNFGNAQDSELTTGGVYTTGEIKRSFKGYYRASGNRIEPFSRSFIPFTGEGDTANAKARAIGGHPALVLKNVCLRKQPDSPYANDKGYVPFGTLVDYAAGRSNGCTSWTAEDAAAIDDMVKDSPTTLYIYPEASDIRAVARVVAAGHSPAKEGLYWNASCLGDIKSPRYWSKDTLEPIIARYAKEHPAPPPRPTPICPGS